MKEAEREADEITGETRRPKELPMKKRKEKRFNEKRFTHKRFREPTCVM
jgi:hypothetical protein